MQRIDVDTSFLRDRSRVFGSGLDGASRLQQVGWRSKKVRTPPSQQPGATLSVDARLLGACSLRESLVRRLEPKAALRSVITINLDDKPPARLPPFQSLCTVSFVFWYRSIAATGFDRLFLSGISCIERSSSSPNRPSWYENSSLSELPPLHIFQLTLSFSS